MRPNKKPTKKDSKKEIMKKFDENRRRQLDEDPQKKKPRKASKPLKRKVPKCSWHQNPLHCQDCLPMTKKKKSKILFELAKKEEI